MLTLKNMNIKNEKVKVFYYQFFLFCLERSLLALTNSSNTLVIHLLVHPNKKPLQN